MTATCTGPTRLK